MAMERVTISIGGMSCAHCVRHVETALRRLPGVVIEEIGVGHATILTDPQKVGAGDLVRAVEASGYTAQVTTG